MNNTLPIILASTSRYRQQLLQRIQLPFTAVAPTCDETPIVGEEPDATAIRLAETKARSLQKDYPAALIIGSDQVAFCDGVQYGKPKTLKKATEMLRQLSDKTLTFYTAVVLLNTATGKIHRHIDTTFVSLRPLRPSVISQYLKREPDALHCAGAAKSEGLGMTLIRQIDSTDPNALIGLPMLRLIDFLIEEKVKL
ncbi:MAG: septum formation protein Maf [Neisseriaceae bacterium]|nr:septum formation protein Maf [Neisseriaceae bacterium]MBR3424589.1 septum formation protein Maf [Neisseriaceae bacterium]